ncbi:MAG: DUF1552 domain-containing protein [Polyangiaceae bacterium]
MSRRALGRRRFLELVGATALTYPFVRSLPSYASADGGSSGSTDPIYLVLLFTSCGTVRYRWGAQGPAPTSTTPTVTSPLVFREMLSAFTKAGPMQVDLTDKVTVLDGLEVKGANGSHEAGMAALWTGLTTTGSPATGPSIDTAISAALGSRTPYANVPLMAQSSADYQQRGVDTRMLYDASGGFVDPFTSPSAAVSTLFPGATASTTTQGPDKKTFLRQKVAAQRNHDLTALEARLCGEDRQQLQNLQAIWNQAEMQAQNAAMAAAACMAPSVPAAPDGGTGTDPFPTYVDAMSNILGMTLACDLTRVASLQLSHALSPVTHSWLGSSQTSTHHNYSHQGPSWLGALGADPYASPSPVASQYPQQLVDIESWYAQKVADLAYTLSQLKTATGKNLLDQTLICWGTELDMGAAHNHDDTPFVVLGSANGQLKTGQLLTFPMDLADSGNEDKAVTNHRAHNDLLLTLAKVMGVNLSTFGEASLCSGPITEMLSS